MIGNQIYSVYINAKKKMKMDFIYLLMKKKYPLPQNMNWKQLRNNIQFVKNYLGIKCVIGMIIIKLLEAEGD